MQVGQHSAQNFDGRKVSENWKRRIFGLNSRYKRPHDTHPPLSPLVRLLSPLLHCLPCTSLSSSPSSFLTRVTHNPTLVSFLFGSFRLRASQLLGGGFNLKFVASYFITHLQINLILFILAVYEILVLKPCQFHRYTTMTTNNNQRSSE